MRKNKYIPKRFKKAMEVEGFTYYMDFDEQDLNANTIVVRNEDKVILSDNYFASISFLDNLAAGAYTFLAEEIAKYKDDILEGYEFTEGNAGEVIPGSTNLNGE